MAVSHKYKYIFLKVPKTASTAVLNYLQSIDEDEDIEEIENSKEFKHYNGHIPAYILRKYLGEEIWNSYTKFGVVRNPYTHTMSHYDHQLNTTYDNRDFSDFRIIFPHNRPDKNYRKSKDNRYILEPKPSGKLYLEGLISLEALLSNWFCMDSVIYTQSYILYHNNKDDESILTIKFENLKKDLIEIFNLIGLDTNFKLPYKNPVKPWRTTMNRYIVLNDKNFIDHVNLYRDIDFINFNYNKE